MLHNLTKTKKYVHRYTFHSPILSRTHLEIIRMPLVKIKSLIPCYPPPLKTESTLNSKMEYSFNIIISIPVISHKSWGNSMSIMQNYMKEGAATCHPLYFQLFKPIPSQTQISSTLVKINQHSKTRPSQAGSCISKTPFHMYTYIYIFFYPKLSLCLFK